MEDDHSKELFNAFIKELYVAWSRERSFVCLLYSALNTNGFSDFSSREELERYVNIIQIDMIYINSTNSDGVQLYRKDLQKYQFVGENIIISLRNGKSVSIRYMEEK